MASSSSPAAPAAADAPPVQLARSAPDATRASLSRSIASLCEQLTALRDDMSKHALASEAVIDEPLKAQMSALSDLLASLTDTRSVPPTAAPVQATVQAGESLRTAMFSSPRALASVLLDAMQRFVTDGSDFNLEVLDWITACLPTAPPRMLEDAVLHDLSHGWDRESSLLALCARVVTRDNMGLLLDILDAGARPYRHEDILSNFFYKAYSGAEPQEAIVDAVVSKLCMAGCLPQMRGDVTQMATCLITRGYPCTLRALQRLDSGVADDDILAAHCVRMRHVFVQRGMKIPREYVVDGDDWSLTSSRRCAHAFVHELIDRGIMVRVCKHTSFKPPAYASMLSLATALADVELMLIMVRAGARPHANEDVYGRLVSAIENATPLVDATGAVLDDAALAPYLKALHDGGLRIPRAMRGSVSTVSAILAAAGMVECVRVVIDVLDPFARGLASAIQGNNLMRVAARAAQAQMCAFLLQQGWTARRCWSRRWTGYDPLVDVLYSRQNMGAATAVCDTIAVLLADEEDVRDVILDMGICEPGKLPWLATPLPFQVRMLLRICSAVGAYPSITTAWLRSEDRRMFPALDGVSLMTPFRRDPMEAHHDGIYLRDPLRIGCDSAIAVAWAVGIDCAFWSETLDEGVRELQVVGVSCTLRVWAYMRRRHAVFFRQRVLKAIAARLMRRD